jgi:hypothetical protein
MSGHPPGTVWSRRQLLVAAGMALAARRVGAAPAARVAIARCPDYAGGVLQALRKMFDDLG